MLSQREEEKGTHMGNIIDLTEPSTVAPNFDPLRLQDDLPYVGPRDRDDWALGPGQFLLALDNGCSHSYAIMRTKEELRRVLQAWLRSLDDGADSEGSPGYPLCTLAEALKGYDVRLGDEDIGLDLIHEGKGKFLLVERHTGLSIADQPYWFSRHTSVQAAREYNANQDCAKDWTVDAIFQLTPD